MYNKPKIAQPFLWSPQSDISTAAPTIAYESSVGSSPPESPELGNQRRIFRLRKSLPWTCNIEALQCLFLGLGILIGALGSALVIRLSTKVQAAYEVPTAPVAVPEAYLAAKPLNNSCLLPHLQIPEGSDKPVTFDACGFVIRSTDEVWNLRGNVDDAIDKYFHEGYINAGSWGRRMIGKTDLREAVLSEMRAFPDIKIHITDCLCKGNDIDGYKCAMPDILEGTNLGPSAYGPATGRYAKWSGLVQSVVKKNPGTGQWQYWAEWGVHDEWALIQQLGLDFSRVPRPARNLEQFHDCAPLVSFQPEPTYDKFDAEAQAQQRKSHNLRQSRPPT